MASAGGESALQKQCRIKTGVVTRTRKELDRYKEEMDNQRAKIEAMRTEGRDEFDIRQQQQVFNETERVIPDTLRRLQKAVDDLTEFIEVNRAAGDLAGSPLLASAEEALKAEGVVTGGGGAGSTADDAI